MRMQEVPGQAGGGSFEIETPIAYRAKQRMCLLCFAATIFLTFDSGAISFQSWTLFPFHLISSHRSFSWKLLIASHCVIPSHLISSHARAFSAFFTSHLGAKAEKKYDFGAFLHKDFQRKMKSTRNDKNLQKLIAATLWRLIELPLQLVKTKLSCETVLKKGKV